MPLTAQLLIWGALWSAATPGRLPLRDWAGLTTERAHRLVLERIDAIAGAGACRQAFGRQQVDLERVRLAVPQIRFYNAEGPEGGLRFSQVVGKPASPDLTLRDLARGLSADAFVLGYQDGPRYVRTRHVVLSRGFFNQESPEQGSSRLTTEEEKQALLLHEVLHVALDVDDDDLARRDLCPLRLLAFCPRAPAGPAATE